MYSETFNPSFHQNNRVFGKRINQNSSKTIDMVIIRIIISTVFACNQYRWNRVGVNRQIFEWKFCAKFPDDPIESDSNKDDINNTALKVKSSNNATI